MKFLIIVAINEELKVVRKLLVKGTGKGPVYNGMINGLPVDVVMTTMGMEAAEKVALECLDPLQYAGVIVVGYCGALSSPLEIGDVVVPSQVTSSKDGFVFKMDLALVEEAGKCIVSEGIKYRAVPMITQPRVVETPEEKDRLYKTTLAEAVDMETSEIVRVARQRQMKVFVMKIVIDDAMTALPRFNDYFEKTGRMDHLNLAPVLVTQPALSLELSKNIRHGARVLKHILPPIMTLLASHWRVKGN